MNNRMRVKIKMRIMRETEVEIRERDRGRRSQLNRVLRMHGRSGTADCRVLS